MRLQFQNSFLFFVIVGNSRLDDNNYNWRITFLLLSIHATASILQLREKNPIITQVELTTQFARQIARFHPITLIIFFLSFDIHLFSFHLCQVQCSAVKCHFQTSAATKTGCILCNRQF